MKNKKKIIAFCAASVALALTLGVSSSFGNSLTAQNMADRWAAGDMKFSQVSVFFPEGKDAYTKETADSMGEFIGGRLNEDSYQSSSDEISIWASACSSVMSIVHVSVTNEYTGRTDTCQTEQSVMGVSDDFFEFHPLTLLSGNYIYPGELRRNRAVLDENAAWQIFSSSDVVGMEFMINGKVFEVAGVVKAEENKAVSDVYPVFPLIYVHYDILEETELDNQLMCYEAVLPDPVSGYAKNMFLEYFGIDTMAADSNASEREEMLSVVIVDNTNRYSAGALWKNLVSFGKGAAVTKPVAYPYWENAARVNNSWLTLLFFIELVLSAFIIVSLIIFFGKLYLNRTWHFKDYIDKLVDKYTYKKRSSDYINTQTSTGKEIDYEKI